MNPEYHFFEQNGFYRGKVREVYSIGTEFLAMKASNRISAFDHILPQPIPFKGQVLNQTAWYYLEKSRHIIPNWALESPFGNITFGYRCTPIPVEMVVRGYLDGHASRLHAQGIYTISGVAMQSHLEKYRPFASPIVTPTTKAAAGHDEDISASDIVKQGIVSKEVYQQMEATALALYAFGRKEAEEKGLILADTKYEFGLLHGKLCLMDEIHTPDSSRYYLKAGYEENLSKGEAPEQLSKEFVRQWLISEGFMGKEGQAIPRMDPDRLEFTGRKYISLFEQVTGQLFQPEKEAEKALVEEKIKALTLKYKG